MLRNFSKEKPFTAALCVLLLVMVPGFWITSYAINEAHEAADKAQATADHFARAEVREEAEEEQELLLACQQRNTFQMGTRLGDARIVDAFENAFLAGADTPEQVAQIRGLANRARTEIFEGRSAQVEDRDCDDSGELDSQDYLP